MIEMSKLEVPIISIVIGEGSSGGALAIGVSNKIYMLENSIYSILSPEGYSSILWKDSTKAKEAAQKMKLTADDLYKMKIIDKIILENTHNKKDISEQEFNEIAIRLRNEIVKEINSYSKMTNEQIKEERYQKYRNIKGFYEMSIDKEE